MPHLLTHHPHPATMIQYNPYEAEVSDAGSESPNRLFEEDNLSPRRIIRLTTKIIVCMTCNRELGVVFGRFELLINVLLKPSANIHTLCVKHFAALSL
jgi:alpha-glucuronidase